MFINILREEQQANWDDYVENHSQGTLYHLSSWEKIIRKSYGHKTYYLMASTDKQKNSNPVVGILPLVHIKHFIFGNSLVSMPFLDHGGILADDKATEKTLLLEAIKLAGELEVQCLELRQKEPLSLLSEIISAIPSNMDKQINYATNSHKVSMLLPVPDDAKVLMRSFKSKLRSQIKKPIREGCRVDLGHLEWLDDFYEVFSVNMRDLGSPVHSKKLFKNVLNEFHQEAKICTVSKDNQTIAASVVIGFKDTLVNPWASSKREHSRLSPNMLLYWNMLEYACNAQYNYFDFGRSTLDGSTYRFKAQWGAEPKTLYWHFFSTNGRPINGDYSQKSKLEKAISCWKKLPVPITTVIGPMFRKYISL